MQRSKKLLFSLICIKVRKCEVRCLNRVLFKLSPISSISGILKVIGQGRLPCSQNFPFNRLKCKWCGCKAGCLDTNLAHSGTTTTTTTTKQKKSPSSIKSLHHMYSYFKKNSMNIVFHPVKNESSLLYLITFCRSR